MKQGSKIIKNILTKSYNLNGLQLQNRFVMAPLTRSRGDEKTGVPSDLMAEYYEQRASFGLVITECSQISQLSNCFPGSGGIHSKDQVEGWKKIVDRVHNKGAKMILQIWHSGRATLSEYTGGVQPIAPSPIAMGSPHPSLNKPHPIPREMTEEDIKNVIEEFRQGALNAKEAGFDGVMLHGANGYLVDQFLRDGSNKRTDKYGGSIENRTRFLLEVLDALISVYGSKRVSVRLSPIGRYGDMYDSNPLELMKYVLGELSKKDLQYVELKRPGAIDASKVNKEDSTKDKYGRTLPHLQIPDFFKTLRPYYKGTLMANDGFNPESAQEGIEKGEFDLVSFGVLSIANPDLPQRIENGWELNTNFDYPNFFTGTAKGYTDYPFYKAQN